MVLMRVITYVFMGKNMKKYLERYVSFLDQNKYYEIASMSYLSPKTSVYNQAISALSTGSNGITRKK